MNWYYASDNQQNGPIDPAEFDRLVQGGIITPSTLVWREGWANWQPYSTVHAPEPPPSLRVAGVVCAECGQTFTADQTIQLGGRTVCAGCKATAMQKLREGVPSNSASEQIRQAHIKHEASIKSVAILYFLSSAIVLLAALVSAFSGEAGAGLIGFLMLGLCAAQIWVGLGLRKLKRWARIPTGILSGIGLIGFPVGTLINAYILYLIFCRKGATVFSDDYKLVIAQTPHIKYRTSVLVWVLLALFVALIGMAIVFALFSSGKVGR